MTEKFAVFLDVDGTLTDGKSINPKNAQAIEMARKAGHYIFVNTGRAKSWVNSELLGNIELDGMISGMGSLIELAGKPIFEKFIDQKFVYSCATHFWNTKNCFFISGVKNGFIINPIPYFKDWHFADIDGPEDFKGRYKNEEIQKIELFGKISDTDKEYLGQELDVYDHGHYIECGVRGCTKSSAMDIVLNHIGIKKENSIAIGDSLNDINMLENAGTAVAIGNAIDKVKQIADFISTPCTEGGVGYAIEKLLLKK